MSYRGRLIKFHPSTSWQLRQDTGSIYSVSVMDKVGDNLPFFLVDSDALQDDVTNVRILNLVQTLRPNSLNRGKSLLKTSRLGNVITPNNFVCLSKNFQKVLI